jgi:transcriptional regulator with XRE-family HTH domain
MKFDQYLKEKAKNPKFKKRFDEYNLAVQLAYEITRAREEAGITQSELGKRIGMSQPAIARLEAGDDINPEFQTISKIAQALQPHFSFVIGEPKKLAAA